MSMRRAFQLVLLLGLLAGVSLRAETAPATLEAPGVWFLLGDASKGYANTVVIEMSSYLIVVDANYPGRARELLQIIPALSPKPVRYVFDTHAHGDHSYGNSVWTAAGATTLAYSKVVDEMNRYEPERWHAAERKRADVRELHQPDVERPQQTFTHSPLVLQDASRRVEFLHLGWGHTQGDGMVWLPKEHILCTGDAAVNGPRNKLWDANIANWPRVLTRALTLHPLVVLPGHGDAGGPEILTGQRQFLIDLRQAVAVQMQMGRTPENIILNLPPADQNWLPKDPAMDIEATYHELKEGKPAGALQHAWR